MDFATFITLTDSNKVYLAEINIGDEVEEDGWTQDGVYTNCWYSSYTVGVLNKVTEDDTEYVERFTLTECDNNAESFYYDLENQVLYLHTVNTDDPGSMTGADYDYKIIAFSWQYFCNMNPEDQPAIFAREEERLEDGDLEVWASATDLTYWAEGTAGGTTTINRESTDPQKGGYCVRIDVDGAGNNGWVVQSPRLKPGAKCRIRFYYKHSAGASQFRIYDAGSNVYLDSNGDWQPIATNIALANQSDWTEFDLEFYAHKDYTNYKIIFYGLNLSTSTYYDNVNLTMYREDNYYYPYFDSMGFPSLEQAVGDYHVGSFQLNFGSLKFLNDGYFYTKIQDYLWHNKELIIKYGAKGSDYEDFELIHTAKTQKPRVGDVFFIVQVADNRGIVTAKQLPATKFWTSDYPNLEENGEGLPVPIVYGDVHNIPPMCVDIVAHKYKISIHALEAIDAVYKDGVALATPADYTPDLANGEFTLTADPVDAYITCDVQGKKCDIEDGTYSTNVADILHDTLVTYLDFSPENIDYASFLDLKSSRTQDHMLYLDEGLPATDIVKILQASALFHLIPLANGKLGAFRYTTGVDSETPRLSDASYQDFKVEYDTSGVYSDVKIKYNKNPSSFSHETVVASDDNVKRKYGIDKTFNLVTSLKVKADAENIRDYYADLMSDPLRKVTVVLPTELFALRPAEKVIFNKVRSHKDGDITVFDEEPYRVLKLSKSFQTGQVDIVAWEDLQSAGEHYCEICYTCQVCNTSQQGITGSCSVCYNCEKCNTGECSSCESCYYCEKCDTGECSTCQVCDACEKCDTGECSTCQVCDACEKCNTGECASCQVCDACENCDTGECVSCEVCVTCENCDTGECAVCQTCNTCEACDTGECASCQVCDACEKCNTGECASCQVCDACQTCVTCELAQCSLCDTCEKCDTCQNAECGSCQVCDACENCYVCEVCDACQTSECAVCQSCDTCEKCNLGECADCQSCNVCQTCNTCEACDAGQCPSCQLCDLCMACFTCDDCDSGQCPSCQYCDLCMECFTCEDCDICMLCVTCERTQCTTCEICNTCETCDGGGCQICVSCMTCDACMMCDSGEF